MHEGGEIRNCMVCHTECVEGGCPTCGFFQNEVPSDPEKIGRWVSSILSWRIEYWKSLVDFEIDGTTLVNYSGNERVVTVPYGITRIGKGAFANKEFKKNLYQVHLPDTVREIGEYAFYACSSLTSLVTGKGLTSIGKLAFADCSALTSVTLYGNGASIGESAFSSCTALTTLVIGEGVTSIGKWAFCYCTNLENVTIGKDVTSIALAAFGDCEVKNVYISDLAAWCNIVFETSISNPLHANANLYLKDGEESTLITNLVIGDGVRLGQDSFSGCGSITGVVISLGAVYEWNAEVFRNCSNLTSIYYGGSWNDWAVNGMFPILNGTNASVYYYSENQPTEDDNFWHYDANGNVAVWPRK